MTKQRHCFVAQVGDAIEALASALDPEREPPFKGDILDLLEWAEKDVLEMRAEIATMKAEKFEAGNNQTIFMVRISELRQQLAALSDHQIAYETQAEQELAEAQAESENLRNVLYQARQDHGYELARLKRIASEQLASRDAEVARLKGMVDEIHAARKVVNQHDKLLVQIHTLRQQLAKAGMS